MMPESEHTPGKGEREAQAWTLRAAGMYGSDVEVVSLDAYQRLAQRCRNAEAAALVWGRKCIQLEGERGPAPLVDDDVLRAVRLPLAALTDPRGEQSR